MHRFLSDVIDVLGKRCLRGRGPRGAGWLNPPGVQPRVLGEAGIRQSRGDAGDAGERAPSLETVCFAGLLDAIGQIPDSQRNKPDSEDLGSLRALNKCCLLPLPHRTAGQDLSRSLQRVPLTLVYSSPYLQPRSKGCHSRKMHRAQISFFGLLKIYTFLGGKKKKQKKKEKKKH